MTHSKTQTDQLFTHPRYRQRRTNRVVLSAQQSSEARSPWLWHLVLHKQRHKSLIAEGLGKVAAAFSLAIWLIEQILAGILVLRCGHQPTDTPWHPSADAHPPILPVGADDSYCCSDSTELRLPPAVQRSDISEGKQCRVPEDMSQDSCSLIPHHSPAHSRLPRRTRWRPAVATKGCLLKGGYLSGAVSLRP